jgi:hypothetical protein
MAIPSIARVPSISLRWKTARSSARSIVSVALAAPNVRSAALNLDTRNRQVRETRRSGWDERFLPAVLGIRQEY